MDTLLGQDQSASLTIPNATIESGGVLQEMGKIGGSFVYPELDPPALLERIRHLLGTADATIAPTGPFLPPSITVPLMETLRRSTTMDPLVRAKAQWALFRGTDWNQQDLGDQVLYVGEVFADGSGRIRVMDLLYRPPLGAGPVASMIAPITLTSSMIILVWFICAIWVFITFVWPNWKAAPPRDPTDAFWRIRRLFFAALALIAAPFLVIYQVGRATVMWLVKRWSKIQPTVLQRANP